MSVAAVGKYEFAPVDSVDKFPAPLLYIGWEDHLMICAPVCLPLPPVLKFGDMLKGPLQGVYGAHPDFAKIDWAKAEWFRSGKPWKPDYEKSLADNGLGHKDVIRFRTPGLAGIGGSFH
ncbi:MAG TPA: phenol hydroxylase subunit P4 [Burkholderiaceae bacterium]|nr:phenol hydroxylase subunit P4 [Burkholderiaceae bacterium]